MGPHSSARWLASGLSGVAQDLRDATRALRGSPGFSAVAILTSALAIGANTAMFSFVQGVLLRPLPYPDPDRIVRVLERVPNGGISGASTLNYLDWAAQNDVFADLAAEAGWRATLGGSGEPIVIRGARVSAHYFDIFGVTPALGRTFRSGDDQPGSDRVVLLSHSLWETDFGSDPAAVGRKLVLDGEPHLVIGVLPRGAFDRARAQIWKPLAFEPSDTTRDFRWLGASARLKPGVTLEQARARMNAIARRLAAAYPGSNAGWGVAVDRLAAVAAGPHLRSAVIVLFASTLLVLLVGAANLANLALARSLSRQRDLAMRAALGASRWRLIRHVLVENLVLSLSGGLVGVGVGYGMMQWIRSLIPPFTLPPAVDVRMDAPVLLFAVAVAVATGVLFGAAPAVRATRPGLTSALGEAGHGTTPGGPRWRVRGWLVVSEVAFAFVLLVGSGLLMRSAGKLARIDPGFDARDVLTATVPLPRGHLGSPALLNAYLASVRAAVATVPGVRETALTSALPLQGWGYGVPYSIAGRDPADPTHRRRAFFKVVSPSYFSALRIKLVTGRVLRDGDQAGAPRVAVINETLAKREFAGENPVGRRILAPELVPGKTGFGREVAWEVVGVVAGEKISGLGDEISAGLYVSTEQNPVYDVSLVVRTGVPPKSLQKAVRAAVGRVNREQAIGDVRTLEAIVDQSMVANRFVGTLLAIFASMALLLAAAGIYGVLSYTAARRAHEMGIRAALGASAGQLQWLVFRGGMRFALLGLGAGLLALVPTTDVISSMLFGVSTHDPVTIAGVAAVLVGAAGLASYLPAWRVTNVDPAEAVRRQ